MYLVLPSRLVIEFVAKLSQHTVLTGYFLSFVPYPKHKRYAQVSLLFETERPLFYLHRDLKLTTVFTWSSIWKPFLVLCFEDISTLMF